MFAFRSLLDFESMRCAIYTRKSTDEGLDQNFNSLHAQREACEAYIASQRGAGWSVVDAAYDDGGYSGGTLARPSLQRLLADVDAGLVDVVVVYKIDRLSRSLRDFVNLVERFERRDVTFVAVTQHFNTTNSMGRLTLNVLLSFAQFEREITSERLKDKFASSRARGMWLCGLRPYGYQVVDRQLVVDDAEAVIVRRIFARYPRVRSARRVAGEITAAGIFNRTGKAFTDSVIRDMLRNRLYRGELVHCGQSLPGKHEAIVTERAWAAAQRTLAASIRHPPPPRKPTTGMLKDLAFVGNGPLSHTFVRSKGRLYRYYVPVEGYGSGSDPAARYRAEKLEAAVVATVDHLTGAAQATKTRAEQEGTIRRLVERIDVDAQALRLTLNTGAIVRCEHDACLRRPP